MRIDPSFTFVSVANAFALRGARIVFADIRPDTLNLDERSFSSLITDRTRAIVAVHYAGVGCEMDVITAAAEQRGIAVVEDNAHGLLGTWRGRLLGTLGTFAALSFHETKNFTSRREPIVRAFSGVRSTSTAGSISVRATCPRS